MPYIVNSKFREIREAAKKGNDKAKMVMQAMRNMSSQDDVDRLMADYYDVSQTEVTMPVATVSDTVDSNSEKPASIPDVAKVDAPEVIDDVVVVDLTETLNGETDDLFDENDLDDISFIDYINGKKKDALRARKNADYFKAYDSDGRAKYLSEKINAYKGKFDNVLKDIERRHSDIGSSLDKYAQIANDMLDDDKELDMALAGNAYNDFTGNDIVMHSFGRHWDEDDNAVITQALKELIDHYGKKNIVAVLNNLKNDNEEYAKHMNNRIDTEIGRYSKNIESLLR